MISGRLYEVDLRLRPNGDSGLVTTSLAALRKYQLESAWTWEHQALVRARPICGSPGLLQQLASLRSDVLERPRVADELANDVVSMRHRMLTDGQQQRGGGVGEFDPKHARGGIVDIEFVVQYLVLAHAAQHPEIAHWSDVVRILESLQEAGLIPVQHANELREAYLALRAEVHLAALQGRAPAAEADTHSAHRQAVLTISNHYLPGLPDLQAFE
jgi:glutamate-ammonia-ligase adenylyltransferase